MITHSNTLVERILHRMERDGTLTYDNLHLTAAALRDAACHS